MGCVALIVAILASSCNDPTAIGSELLEEQFSDINFTDTITIRAATVEQDSIFTHTRVVDNQPDTYLFGYIDDPIFGVSESAIYFDLGITANSTLAQVDFTDAVLDSVVLSLGYNDGMTYGDTLLPHNMKVYRLSEAMDYNQEFYYSDKEFDVFPNPIGELDFTPKPSQTLEVIEEDDTLTQAAHIRIPLDLSLGDELMPQDSVEANQLYQNDQTFRALFKGIKLQPAQNNSCILGFNLRSVYTYMQLYYTQDEQQKTFTYRVVSLGTKHNNFKHSYTGASSEPFIDDATMGDSLVFAQGMSGYHVKVDFPHIENLGDIVVNKAELELTFADLPGDDTITYNHPYRMALTRLHENGNFVFIQDITDAILIQDVDLYGGTATMVDENGQTVRKYALNLSNHLQDIVDGKLNDNDLYIQVYLKNQFAYRGAFFGPGHSVYPMKLNLAYTRL